MAPKKKIEIKKAGSLEFDKRTNAQRLIGDVAFKHEEIWMYCDSAYYFESTNSLDAYGHVKIVGDSIDLTGDSLHYEGDSKLAKVYGDIVLKSQDIVLNCVNLDFNLETSVGKYVQGGVITNSKDKSVLKSKLGYFHSSINTFFFKKEVSYKTADFSILTDTLQFNTSNNITTFLGPTHITSKDSSTIYCERGWTDIETKESLFKKDVKMVSKEQTIEGDSIFYNDSLNIALAYCNVVITDTVQDLVIKGDFARFNRDDSTSLVTGQAEMDQILENDTLFLHADTLKANRLKNDNIIKAYNHVKFYKSDMQGMCDSMAFTEADSSIKLFSNPLIWTGPNQLSSDSMRILKYDGKIQQIYLYKNAFISSKEDSTHYNQINGKLTIGYFQDNALNKIHVIGNGRTIYFAKDDEDKMIGMNTAVSRDMIIYVDSNEVKRINFIDHPTATLFPPKDITPANSVLDGFKWYSANRPMRKEDIFTIDEPSKTR